MGIEAITIRVHSEAARAFNSASPEEQRKLEAIVSLRLLEAMKTPRTLKELMDEIGRNAQRRGITPDILMDILDEG